MFFRDFRCSARDVLREGELPAPPGELWREWEPPPEVSRSEDLGVSELEFGPVESVNCPSSWAGGMIGSIAELWSSGRWNRLTARARGLRE